MPTPLTREELIRIIEKTIWEKRYSGTIGKCVLSVVLENIGSVVEPCRCIRIEDYVNPECKHCHGSGVVVRKEFLG